MKLKRTAMGTLEAWKSLSYRRPLIIRGARQTGKTWLVNEFASSHYSNIIRLDFMQRNTEKSVFDGDLDPKDIIRQLQVVKNERITPGETLIFLDEIQECPRALTSLKYFTEQAPEYDIIATGSYMGMSRHQGTSFPVGKVDMMTLHPLTFTEFLRNIGQDIVADLIEQAKFDEIPTALSRRMRGMLKTYMYVGGMPAPLVTHLSGGTPTEVRHEQNLILDAYDLDFSKHAPQRLEERIRLVWNTLPAQFAKENRKFVYGVARPGARARQFEETLMWLRDYGIITPVPCLDAIRMPLAGYENPSAFKVYVLDTGLLAALANLDPTTLLSGNTLFTEFKGALTEQYVCQQLVSQQFRPHYWANPNPRGHAEVDFVVELHMAYPLEVKSEQNVHAKSLGVAYKQYKLPHAIRTGMIGYKKQSWVDNIPLWCVDGLREYLRTAEEEQRWAPLGQDQEEEDQDE